MKKNTFVYLPFILMAVLLAAWLIFPTDKTAAQIDFGGGGEASGCDAAKGGGTGDFVPVCEVNPKIIDGADNDKTFLDELMFLATEDPQALSELLQLGGLPAAHVPDGSILGNLQNLNTFHLFDTFVFQYIKEQFKLQAIDSMANQTTQWVTGDGENPQFIQNWESYLSGAYDLGYLSAGRDLLESELCPQFREQLIEAGGFGAAADFPLDLSSQFIRDMNCTLDPLLEELGSSREAYQADFRNGGWSAYSEQLFKPQNTYYGALFTSLDEAERRANTKQNAAQQEAVASNGYLPVKRCINPAGAPPEECLQYQVTSPASVFESALDASVKSRFDYVVNADQYMPLLNILLNSFVNKLSAAGEGGLYEYGSEAEENTGGGYLGTPTQKPPAENSELRWACYDPISGNSVGRTFTESGGGLEACRAQTTCGTSPARCGLCMPEGGVDCSGDEFFPLPEELEGPEPIWPEIIDEGAQPIWPDDWLSWILGLFDWFDF